MPRNLYSGLARGLRDLPYAIQEGRERRKREAYTSELSSTLGDGTGPIDYTTAARIALKHGDLKGASEFEQHGELRRQRERENEREDFDLDFTLEDRRIAAQDRSVATQERGRKATMREQKMFAKRLQPHVRAGDTAAINRLIAQNPGIADTMLGLPPSRRVVGMEEIVDPEGNQRWSPRIENDDTRSTGPMTANASADQADQVLNISPDQFLRSLSPWLDDKTTSYKKLNEGQIFEESTGEFKSTGGATGKPQKVISVDGRVYDPNTKEFHTPDPTDEGRLEQASDIIKQSIPTPQGFDRRGIENAAKRRSTALSLAQVLERYYGVPVESSAAAIASILQGDNEFSEALLGDNLEASNAATNRLLQGLAKRFGAEKNRGRGGSLGAAGLGR